MKSRLGTGATRPRSKAQRAVKRHKIVQRLTPETITQLLADYRAGSSTPRLAQPYDISPTAVKRLLHERGCRFGTFTGSARATRWWQPSCTKPGGR